MSFRIFTVNPGSTSTKIALFEDGEKYFDANVTHQSSELDRFDDIAGQLDYRRDTILELLAEAGYSLEGTDAFVGRGGGLVPLVGGTYRVNEIMLSHARQCLAGPHPATLGCQLAHSLKEQYGGSAFVVNPPDVDEFCDYARMTGIKGVYRESRVHALNQKEVAIRHAASIGKKYEELNLIVAHLGGGISIAAHRQGRMIDSNDTLNGDGPFAPTRCGAIAVKSVLGLDSDHVRPLITKAGGLVSHLGTSDVVEVHRRIDSGDRYAELVYESMIYQIAKQIGAMAAVLKGKVDAIILTGGIARDNKLVETLKESIEFVATVTAIPGEFEMEALAAGALRVLKGEETSLEYSGVPVWNGFDV